MLPDEILRLDQRQCIALFQGRKPVLLYKLAPEELPDYMTLKSCKVIDYIPEWKRQEEEKAKPAPAPTPPPAEATEPVPTPPSPPPPEQKEPLKAPPPQPVSQPEIVPIYDCPDMKTDAAGGLGMVEAKAVRDCGDEEDDSPPGR